MKKRTLAVLFALCATVALSACGKKEEPATVEAVEEPVIVVGEEEEEEEPEVVEEVEEEEEEVREGFYRSELTNEWIDESLKNQRPILAMVDNESLALPHYGVNDCDIVYEMTNSTQNGGITRLMCVMKDWGNVKQLGSIRSVRPTNLQIAPEYNGIVCHDGGPFYIDLFLKNDFVYHLSGVFSRVDNGKSREYTEYIKPGDMEKNISNAGGAEYNDYYVLGEGQQHFNFVSEKHPEELTEYSEAIDAKHIELPFDHNSSELNYDESTGLYKYSEYGKEHVDAGDDNKVTTFKNLFIQNAVLTQFDEHGYMMFTSVASGRDGWYITNGKAIPVTWTKIDDLNPTRFYDKDGNEVKTNTGKSYIAIVREERFGDIVIE